MRRYVFRRIIFALPVLFGVVSLVFVVFDLAPGDATTVFMGAGVDPEAVEQMRRNFGFDESLPVRYTKWLTAFASGDFGYSFHYGRPVASVLRDVLPNTLLLSVLALGFAFVVGIAVGVVQAMRHNSALDSALSLTTLFFYSIPSFWLAIVLVFVFAVVARNVWDWPIYFPPSGTRSIGYASLGPMERLADRAYHLVLPVSTLTLVLAAGVARYTRGSMLEVVRQDFVRAARAKGLPERYVLIRHALRNALLPVVTQFGLYIPILLSGAVFVEVVFAWPGMGKILVDAARVRDLPLVMASSVLFATMAMLGSLMADVLYALLDPRVRYDRGS